MRPFLSYSFSLLKEANEKNINHVRIHRPSVFVSQEIVVTMNNVKFGYVAGKCVVQVCQGD
jgi:hypothetical protein